MSRKNKEIRGSAPAAKSALVEINDRKSPIKYAASILELSASGMLCLGKLPEIPRGTQVTVFLDVPSWFGTKHLRIPAAVLRQESSGSSQEKMQTALLFNVQDEAVLKALNSYLIRVGEKQQKLDGAQAVESNLAEGLRMLQVSLGTRTSSAGPRIILVTSSLAGEGKTFIAARLGVTMARQGQSVLLVDGDLRRPTLHKLFATPLSPGLAEFRVDQLESPDLKPLMHDVETGVVLIPAGYGGMHPSEAWAHISPFILFQHLKSLPFSYVIVDSPPLLVAAEVSLLAASADDVLLVVRSGATRERAVRQARVLLERNHANLLGVVFNDQADSLQPPYMRLYQSYYGGKNLPKFGNHDMNGADDQRRFRDPSAD